MVEVVTACDSKVSLHEPAVSTHEGDDIPPET